MTRLASSFHLSSPGHHMLWHIPCHFSHHSDLWLPNHLLNLKFYFDMLAPASSPIYDFFYVLRGAHFPLGVWQPTPFQLSSRLPGIEGWGRYSRPLWADATCFSAQLFCSPTCIQQTEKEQVPGDQSPRAHTQISTKYQVFEVPVILFLSQLPGIQHL